MASGMEDIGNFLSQGLEELQSAVLSGPGFTGPEPPSAPEPMPEGPSAPIIEPPDMG